RRFEELRLANPGLPGIARVSAWLHLLAHSPEAERFVHAWIVESQGDPDAWLCRLRLQLRAGELEAACDDAVVAVQRTADDRAVLAEIVQCCLDAEAEATPGLSEQVRILTQRFQVLLARSSGTGGGR
ncbi:MAG: hypothetical protein JNK15_09505, partial [Planctomycetes bacterium]|nr:hypothetical protein [Planctomycetota bacterium]